MTDRLAIVDDDPVLLDQLRWALKGNFEILCAADAVSGLALLDHNPDLYLVDLRLPPSNEAAEGLDLIREIRSAKPEMTIVVMTGEEEHEYALKAVDLGAFDFFRKPLNRDELLVILSRAAERRRLVEENRALRDEIISRKSFDQLVGSTPGMLKLFDAIRKVAPSDATVLIQGESGTGKELVAHSIHRASPRKGGPFVAVNGAALQDTLAESDLFGHEKGAFTGAIASRPGKFEMAQHGTLFLDEIGIVSAAVQAKLLRALESREIERVGATRTTHVDIRLISATNENLEDGVQRGSFREDLYYRINSVVLRIPPLRERTEDIPLLVDFFAARYARHHGRPQKHFSPRALELFGRYPWRGNVRELQHLIEMLTLMVEGTEITPKDLPSSFADADDSAASLSSLPFPEAVASFEKRLLIRAIEEAGGVKLHAARRLGLDANQMKYLCRKYAL